MGVAYSQDLRDRVMAAVDGGLGVYAAAPLFRVSVSYIYKALGRRRASGDVTHWAPVNLLPRSLRMMQTRAAESVDVIFPQMLAVLAERLGVRACVVFDDIQLQDRPIADLVEFESRPAHASARNSGCMCGAPRFRKLVPLAALKQATAALRGTPAPLLEKEGDPCSETLVAHVNRPYFITTPKKVGTSSSS